MKRITAVFLSLLLGLAACLGTETETLAAESWPEPTGIASASVVVMEINSGTVLYEKNSHDRHYPASITKILTTLLGLENCDPDETVTFSADAVYKNEGDTSHIARDLGEQMTLEQTLYAVMLESANECAYATAEHVGEKLGGDYTTFIDLMNERAAALGCTDTHFNNCNGLPDSDHYTSAYDMALIGCEAYKNADFRKITGATSYTIPPTNKHSDPTYLNNHHNVLHYYTTSAYINPYCTGGKTGYTTAAKSTLVTFAEKDGMAICVVVLYADSPDHYKDTDNLIDWAFDNFSAVNISENETDLQIGDRGLLNENQGFVVLDPDACVILPNGADFSDTVYEETETTDIMAEAVETANGDQAASDAVETANGDQAASEAVETANGDQAASEAVETANGDQAASEAVETASSDQAASDTGSRIAELTYTYAGRIVGTASILTKEAGTGDSIFRKDLEEEEQGVIAINLYYLLAAAAAVCLFVAMIVVLARRNRFVYTAVDEKKEREKKKEQKLEERRRRSIGKDRMFK